MTEANGSQKSRPKMGKRRLRRKMRESLTSLLDRKKAPETSEPAGAKEPTTDPEPESVNPKHEKPVSDVAVEYNPMTAPGAVFTDVRKREYEIGPKGQLRVLNKPRSRVKKRREERAQKETKAGGTKA